MTDETFAHKVQRVADHLQLRIEAAPEVVTNLSDNERGADPDVLEREVGAVLASRGYAVLHWQGQLYAAKTPAILNVPVILPDVEA